MKWSFTKLLSLQSVTCVQFVSHHSHLELPKLLNRIIGQNVATDRGYTHSSYMMLADRNRVSEKDNRYESTPAKRVIRIWKISLSITTLRFVMLINLISITYSTGFVWKPSNQLKVKPLGKDRDLTENTEIEALSKSSQFGSFLHNFNPLLFESQCRI